MLTGFLTKVFGSKHDRDQKKLWPVVEEINEFYESYQELSDEELNAKTGEFRERLANGETLDDLLPEAFAVVKDVCRRHVDPGVGRQLPSALCSLGVGRDMFLSANRLLARKTGG